MKCAGGGWEDITKNITLNSLLFVYFYLHSVNYLKGLKIGSGFEAKDWVVIHLNMRGKKLDMCDMI